MRIPIPRSDSGKLDRELWLMPFCASCGVPVERFTVFPGAMEGYIIAETECHGKTTGACLPVTLVDAMMQNNERIKFFEREEGFDSVR